MGEPYVEESRPYDIGTDVGKMRFEIPDTEEPFMLGDAEISYALEEEESLLGAAARCCEVIARKYAQQADIATGDAKLTYSAQAETLAKRAEELRLRSQGAQAPYCGGQSVSRKESLAEDEGRVQPAFQRGQFNGPGGA